MKKKFLLLLLLVFAGLSAQQKTFTNPLLPSGADPYSTYHNGYYYYTHTVGDRLMLWKTKSLADLKNAESKLIWTPTGGTDWSKDIWAPEFHFINNKWYAYFAADGGHNNGHRMYVLENASEDPFKGTWEFKGKVTAAIDRWAIDGNVFFYNKQQYMIWSGWEGESNSQQNIYIAKMSNPWTIEGNRVLLSQPTYNWEMQGDLNDAVNPPHVNVNEGPQFLQHGKDVFIIYSASGCWTDFYALGMLRLTGNDPMVPQNWTKSEQPVFAKNEANSVYAPGHNSFFKSPDGKEDWILFHANDNPGEGCGNKRSPRMQKISWNKNGTPNLGTPVSNTEVLKVPSE